MSSQPNINASLNSSTGTATVNFYSCHGTNGQEIWLIDTPGFDDTEKANAKVLREIASFLCTFCDNKGLSIGGMIYVHRITDPRMSSSSLKSIRIFEHLCGESNFPAVYIVTTMWDMLRTKGAKAAAMEREELLRSRVDFFGHLVAGGATFPSHEDTVTESLKIVDHLAARKIEVDLEVRREMRSEAGFILANTSVGRFLQGDLEKKRRKYGTRMDELELYRRAVLARDDDSENEGKDHWMGKDADEGYDHEEMVDDFQEHERLMEEIKTETEYLNVTYEQMIEESKTRLTEDEQSLKALERETFEALEQKLDRLRLDTELKDERLLDQAERLKDQTKTIVVRDEAIRELEEKLSRAKYSSRERKLFATLFTLPLSRLLSGPFTGETSQKQQRPESVPPDSRAPKYRESRVKSPGNSKRHRQRRTTRPDVKLSPSQELQHIASHEHIVSSEAITHTDYEESPLDPIEYPYYEDAQAFDDDSFSQPQHFPTTASSLDEYTCQTGLEHVVWDPRNIQRKYDNAAITYKYPSKPL